MGRTLCWIPFCGYCPNRLRRNQREGDANSSTVDSCRHVRLWQRVLVKHGFHGAFYLHHVAEQSKSRRSKQAIRSTKHWKIPPGNFTVGIWGDLTIRKSPHEMMEAWNEFSMKKKDVSLWIHHSNHRQMVPPWTAGLTLTSPQLQRTGLMSDFGEPICPDALLHCSTGGFWRPSN